MIVSFPGADCFVMYYIFESLEPKVVVHRIMCVCGAVYMWYVICWFVSEFDVVWVNVLFAAVVCKCFANISAFSLLVSACLPTERDGTVW